MYCTMDLLLLSTYSSQQQQPSSSSPESEETLELDEAERERMNLLTSTSFKWDYSHHLEKFVRWMPKVELHVHFDGTWDPTVICQHLRDEHGTKLDHPMELWDPPTRPYRSIYDMRKAFEVFLPIVRGNLELLEHLALDFVKRQAQQHIIYTEMRYSPHLLAQGGSHFGNQQVNADPVVDAITKGLRRGEEEYGVKVNQILCCITWRPDWADDVVRLCYERCHDTPCAVVGIDIAAGEEHLDSSHQPYTYQAHKRAMERARQLHIPITLHAGEIFADSIPIAILEFGATRIGHGYRMSSSTMQLVKDAGVHVEICPTTSVETGGWLYENDYDNDNASTTTTNKNWKNHPAVHMMKYGLDLSLNSDDPSVFDTSLTWQWRIALGKMGFSVDQVKEMTKNAIRAAFLSNEEKESLLRLVEQHTPYMQPRLLKQHSFSDRVTGHYKVCMENC